MARVEAFEAQATQRAQANEAKTAQLEEAFEVFKLDSERTIAQLRAENDLLRTQPPRRRS
jgi:hypothetical protein